MLIETLSTFPHMYDSVMGESMMKRAQEKGLLEFRAHDLRDWTHDRHRTTDDDPYGGGAGLVMKCEPIFEAYEAIAGQLPAGIVENTSNSQVEQGKSKQNSSRPSPASSLEEDSPKGSPEPQENDVSVAGSRIGDAHQASSARAETSCGRFARAGLPERLGVPDAGSVPHPTTIFLSPCGEPFDDALACELAGEERLLFVCGHYEGIDERAYALADRTISLGDYVLTSGELASMVVIDAVVRKLPGVLGAEGGALDESFADGLLEYPQYTRPAEFRGMEVPPVLLSGNHAAVARWRRERSLERTARLRPDLLESVDLLPCDREFLRTLSNGAEA